MSDRDPWVQWEEELAQMPTQYEYFVLGDPTISKIYVSKDGDMTRHDIAAQLRRLADYVDGLTDDEAVR